MIKWIMIIFVGFFEVLVSCYAQVQAAELVVPNQIGILPFSKLVSSAVDKKIGPSYLMEKKLATALKKKGVKGIKSVKYPNGQAPFTYEEMEAPAFEIDADDFATPEQILSEIASTHGLDKVIFGHLEEVSDSLYLVVRVYSRSSNTITSLEEQEIKTTGLKSANKVTGAINKLAGDVQNKLAVEVKKIVQETPVSGSDNLLDGTEVGLLGVDDDVSVGYSVEDVYRKILEYEFYVVPPQRHNQIIGDLAQKFSTTRNVLVDELKNISRFPEKTYYGVNNVVSSRKYWDIYKITSNPKGKGRLITPSKKVFELCILSPNPGFRGLTYQEAKELVNKMNKKHRKVMVRQQKTKIKYFDKWRIPTIEELFAITQYLEWPRRNNSEFSFWSKTLTDKAELWTFIKFRNGTTKRGKPRYGIDFAPADPNSGDRARLVAVHPCK
ncbi:hypothetical protein PN36_08825 [Candidatus Thiomargarita nelsonii]|uniref:Uncharacterized protein n=1 Tax=Candidatus Thiomargarita nelsonii TaxID=1003181 RepID=A0A0A6P8D9_9GAMM|nr:hypothetical protein PN36_08825 [Candidatus Thiomargarita nelsonii]